MFELHDKGIVRARRRRETVTAGQVVALCNIGAEQELTSRVVYGRLDGDRSQAASFC
jgi:hypothetical protein